MGSRGDVNLSATALTEEVLYTGERTRIARLHGVGGVASLILKTARGGDAIRALQHERSILERLVDVRGVARLATADVPPDTLALHDVFGTPLSLAMQETRFDLPQILSMAGTLARTLVDVHARGVTHSDINPSNILVSGAGHTPTLIDFNTASHTGEHEPVASQRGNHIAGTLAYMSPEQTGRTGRSVDHRTDLYSLGITLYELSTGQKPFEGDDLLDLVHAHLVREPADPASLNPQIPPALSAVILHLLEKEPDRRYQSAEGLAHDLARVGDALQRADSTPFLPGEFDFGTRLKPPVQLIGRDAEIAFLREAVTHAADGRSPCLLVAGQPGVGKSALLNELRPLVTARHGWFLYENFERFRQDAQSAAMQTLGRQLLAEPEVELAMHRERILMGLSYNLGIGPSLLPEFMLLLGQHDAFEVSNPREGEARVVQATLALLRSVASAERPIVLVYDDVQWAPSLTLQFLDALVTASDVAPGLLVVCSYRPNAVDAEHPLHGLIERWKTLGLHVPRLDVESLHRDAARQLVGSMLRMPEDGAAPLADALAERTQNIPYNMVEVLNALRQDGLLVLRERKWHWDADTLRRHVGDSSVADLLGRRLARLPEESMQLLRAVACLGGALTPQVLAAATALDPLALPGRLAAALDDGVLLLESGESPLLRFSHGRVQQAVFDSMLPGERFQLHLALARSLSADATHDSLAADQYLPAAEALTEEAECRRAVDLFVTAAQRLRLPNSVASERFIAGAIHLLDGLQKTAADGERLFHLKADHHRTLFGLGRHEELDVAYADLAARRADPILLAEPARLQMYSLVNRGRFADAMSLGMSLLSDLGLPRPTDIRPAIGAGFQRLASWNASNDKQGDFDRPEIDDPRVLAWASIVAGAGTAAYFADPPGFAWLVLEAHRLWVEYGPTSRILSTAGAVPFLLVGAPQDYRGAHEASRHMFAVGEARGYEPGTSITRCIFGLAAGHWVDPVESVVLQFRRARHDLMTAGDASFCSYSFLASDMLFDCEPSLDAAANEIEAGLTYYARTGNEDSAVRFRARRQLIRAMRGTTHAPGALGDDGFDEEAYVLAMDPGSTTAATYHMLRAISAAIYGDMSTLIAQCALAMPLMPRTPGYYLTAPVRALHGLALAEKARSLPVPERGPVLEELNATCLKWLTARAADAPANFLHLQRWIEAEHAWACGQVWAAGAAFDVAVQEAALHARPWHRALICERAALFHLAHGMEHSARPLMVQACDLYERWGAAGKVRELRRSRAFLRASSELQRAGGTLRSTVVANDMVDMLAVLRASQALSSQTSLARLTEQLNKVLGAMTGATSVQLLVRPSGAESWFMATSMDVHDHPVTVEEAGSRGQLALTVFRYAERTAELLVLDDVTRDDRFATDPYLSQLGQCSMLLAPIMSHGALSAMLVLENRLSRGAFSADRLDAVTLIAGQLSVSLENALLYASLERKVAERTEALEDANRRLEQLSLTDALTGLSNRRRFNEAFETQWTLAMRAGTTLGLVMIDIDFFKLYNDHYGHQGGDDCLKLVASTMSTDRRRAGDVVARYGGEEFVMLLPNADMTNTRAVAERVRSAVAALQEPHLKSALGTLTISLGVSSVAPAAGDRPQDLMAAADAALYEAKRAGRNQVASKPFART